MLPSPSRIPHRILSGDNSPVRSGTASLSSTKELHPPLALSLRSQIELQHCLSVVTLSEGSSSRDSYRASPRSSPQLLHLAATSPDCQSSRTSHMLSLPPTPVAPVFCNTPKLFPRFVGFFNAGLSFLVLFLGLSGSYDICNLRGTVLPWSPTLYITMWYPERALASQLSSTRVVVGKFEEV